MPLPMMTPQRIRVFLGEVQPAVLDRVDGGDDGELGEAVEAAASARGSTTVFRVEVLHLRRRTCTLKSVVSNRSMGPMPLLPASRPCQ